MHEEDAGTAWKHVEYRNGHNEIRRMRRLVVSFVCTIANYDVCMVGGWVSGWVWGVFMLCFHIHIVHICTCTDLLVAISPLHTIHTHYTYTLYIYTTHTPYTLDTHHTHLTHTIHTIHTPYTHTHYTHTTLSLSTYPHSMDLPITCIKTAPSVVRSS